MKVLSLRFSRGTKSISSTKFMFGGGGRSGEGVGQVKVDQMRVGQVRGRSGESRSGEG